MADSSSEETSGNSASPTATSAPPPPKGVKRLKSAITSKSSKRKRSPTPSPPRPSKRQLRLDSAVVEQMEKRLITRFDGMLTSLKKEIFDRLEVMEQKNDTMAQTTDEILEIVEDQK
ncbi:hypothetical protein TARUN_5015 [Trichoderma arundinaceum]|uniref:Uncharacterized protein n=1 Tax=Trichoderma arundinaceum TaxID=490622 RepID=A0A395NMT8_TRIAR|nr:hypothetical protein TARUN_5015 [Trichoderma arundinaceum]